MTGTAVKARIIGRVQGVSYRAWTQETARTYGLAGWVRNCDDGTVEAVFSGAEDRVKAMLTACRTGPPAAKVEEIETGPVDAGTVGNSFEIRR